MEQMAGLAARHDTTVSWAFIRELLRHEVSVRLPRTHRHARDARRAETAPREDVAWCFRNFGSPMDLR